MGDTDRAISQLELALAIDSTLASAHAGRGSILMQERQLRQAAAAFQRASVFEPNNPAHLVQLGMVQCELQEWAAGRDSFRGAVAIDSMQHAGYLGWAVAARGMQNLEEAERVLLRAVALMPESNTVKLPPAGRSSATVGSELSQQTSCVVSTNINAVGSFLFLVPCYSPC